MRGIVFFDCDGVLTENYSSWLVLHEYFGSPDNSYFARLYRDGIISYLDWMKIDIASMINAWGKAIKRDDVEKALSRIRIKPEAPIVSKMLREMGFLVGVISSGVDLLVKRVCREIGSDICLYNELLFINDELVPGGRDWVPLGEKPLLIEKIAGALGIPLERVVYVGDSVWDTQVFRVVGLPIAIEPCGEACSEAKYVIKSLEQLPEIISKYYGLNLH